MLPTKSFNERVLTKELPKATNSYSDLPLLVKSYQELVALTNIKHVKLPRVTRKELPGVTNIYVVARVIKKYQYSTSYQLLPRFTNIYWKLLLFHELHRVSKSYEYKHANC